MRTKKRRTKGQLTLLSVPAETCSVFLTSGTTLRPDIVEKRRLLIEQRRAQRAEEIRQQPWHYNEQSHDFDLHGVNGMVLPSIGRLGL